MNAGQSSAGQSNAQNLAGAGYSSAGRQVLESFQRADQAPAASTILVAAGVQLKIQCDELYDVINRMVAMSVRTFGADPADASASKIGMPPMDGASAALTAASQRMDCLLNDAREVMRNLERIA